MIGGGVIRGAGLQPGYFDSSGRLDPFVVGREAALGADGADDHVASDGSLSAAFDDAVEGDLHAFSALFDDSHALEVAIERSRAKIVVPADGVWALPREVVGLDVFTVGVGADFAFTGVAGFWRAGALGVFGLDARRPSWRLEEPLTAQFVNR
jgi:hypothetical protein